ncbi:MAG TPA: hypothetical protein VF857_10930, partial [Spirochaetota bacterium]
MKKVGIVFLTVGLLFSFAGSAEVKTDRVINYKIDPLQKDLEIQLALSALPPHLRDKATVYIQNPDKGFEVARKGTN